VQKFGGEKALTKHLPEDALKCHLDENLDDAKIQVVPQLVDNTLPLCAPGVPVGVGVDAAVQPKKPKVRMVKTKMTTTKSRLEKATSQLYDLESGCAPEKVLNIDLDLYQMENY
jgi:hypothetical protein